MGNDKTYNKPVYNELIRVSNLYYSNCSLSDLLDYLAGVSGFTFILTDAGFHPAAARLAFSSHRNTFAASDHAFGEIPPLQISLLSPACEPESDTAEFSVSGETVVCKALPLPNYSYYLCIDKKIELTDSRFLAIVENALPFLALTLDKETAFTAAGFSNNFYAPFLQVLHSSSSKTPDEIRNICNIYNFNPDLKRVCMTLQLQDSEDNEDELRELISRLRKYLNADKYFLVYNHNFASVFLLYPYKDQDLDIITKSYVLSNNLYKELESRFSLRIGISSAHFGVETIALSFEESFKSIKVQKQLNLSNSASSYFEQSIYHILNIPELKDFRKLSRDIISPLIEYDANNDTNFFETLQQYFHNSFNIQKTARALYIHRNTLTYRLQHIKELLKFDFDFEHNTDALFTLYLCICVYQLGYHKDFTS